ncbi:MAG: Type 1 glutamine amidotransferase-like domain-containing protein, partial [Nanoarchaeota archaeon]|nr:Type 1 glutamine amidotransferase-like domain-containing protein [Nanoarchaeota archaeon]
MSNGILFLSGGGSEKESYNLDKEFAKLLKRKLLYIPIAINEVKHPYKECLKWLKEVFRQFNFESIEMWTDLSGHSGQDMIKFDGVYIGGGNTFKLLKQLKDTKFDKLLIEYYKRGGNIYGGSAGAIILGKDIITASKDDKNEVKLKETKGMGLINEFSICCHYKLEEDGIISELANA